MFSTEGRAARAGLLLLVATTAACSVYEEDRLRAHAPASVAGQGAAGRSGERDAQVPDAALSECSGEARSATCTRPNALTACVEGDCVLVECTAPFVDCDGSTNNGCEARLDSLEHCGLCGARCALPGADARCVEGRCELAACRERYGDCDGDPGNGCETSLVTLDDCGACGHGCDPFEHAAPGCFSGTCGVSQCLGLFGDCDGEAENGCEEPLRNTAHCGACDKACSPPSAVGNCDTGACTIVECEGDAVDCNGLVGDGCEADLSSPEQCGACGAACELPPHATAVLCAPDETTRCQVDHRCGEDPDCDRGAPTNGCEAGYSDCNGESADGCETPLGSLSDCGGCGDRCAIANAISACEDGACEFERCEPGFDQCGSSDCSPLASDEAHCGSCDNACSGTTPNCFGGRCTGQSCSAGRADCNGAAGDGCETRLDTLANCGQCGIACAAQAHATPTCSSGRCAIGECDEGFADCDGVASNGCEVDLRTLDDCGACRAVCNVPFAEESCERGRCELVACEPNRADCNQDLADGCETSVLLPNNCGSCGNDCTALPNVLSGGCSEGECTFVCKEGFGDCDGDPSNGCEGAFDSGEHCGACGNDCTALPNVLNASCDGTRCGELDCEPGFGDCDGITENGCERRLDTQEDCGACNKPCAPAHGQGECGSGQCRVTSCDTGYDDCNGDDADGCEASLALPAHCGSCGNDCGDQPLCENGKCGCTESSQCGSSSLSCCNNTCVNTNSVCSLWPCPVASTRRELLHCGGCGVFCPDVAAFFCCGALGE